MSVLGAIEKATIGRTASPSAFSIMRGCLPSMTATAEFVVPKSMPMTWPLTFSSAYPLVHDAPRGDLRIFVRKVDDARGRNWHGKLVVAMVEKKFCYRRGNSRSAIAVTPT